ncbi:chorismate mutase / prephenate dehydratase [Paraburkholderia phenazinium]|uniref:Bifunctional chorismate mutase/prephenate dehydratase n=1 Tax=Paraburkholderia phenazinium TaxID=60549 RepID=A0A1G7YXR1_9BURK|nr:prephenate dehydratase [Paraburkholderia phenazinium]SDH01293.1 chorismate mutase / prephenate dehydratase [Paraburkholderia phenazinium]
MDHASVDVQAACDQKIDQCRDTIDRIDAELIELLSRRAECAMSIGRAKAAGGIATWQQAREKHVLERIASLNRGPLRDGQLESIWQAIMRANRELQAHGTVAYLGPTGTYSEDALRTYYGEAVHTQACASLDEVFDAVVQGGLEHAVVPIENSTEGPVMRTLDLLLDSPVSITGEVVIPICHTLLSVSTSLEEIECVGGHPQALAQCRGWLARHLPGARREETASNGDAARRASGKPGYAAIAGGHAAVKYGLRIVAEAIQDVADNRTRFLVLGQHAAASTGFDRTTLAVDLPNSPGALARFLTPIGRHEVSVLWMESRPQRAAPWSYRFLVDIAGHRDDPEIRAVLADLERVVERYRVLGSYPRFEKEMLSIDTLHQAWFVEDGDVAQR